LPFFAQLAGVLHKKSHVKSIRLRKTLAMQSFVTYILRKMQLLWKKHQLSPKHNATFSILVKNIRFELFLPDLLHLLENTFDRNVFPLTPTLTPKAQ